MPYISECRNLPSLYCTCSKSINYSCPAHLGNHISIQHKKNHEIFSTVKFITIGQKETLQSSIISTIKQFKDLKKQIYDQYKAANDMILKSILKVDKMIGIHKKMLKEAITQNQSKICVSHNKKYKDNQFSCEILSLIKKSCF